MPGIEPWTSASLWSEALPSDRPPRPANARWDVIVVGAGLTGLVTATVLQRAGLDVLVVDRHGIGGVTSRGSTGKLTALQGQLLPKIERHRGRDAAATYATAARAGVAGLRQLIDEVGVACDLVVADDHVFATEADGLERARKVFDAARHAGLPVTWTEATELPVAVGGAVRLDDQAQLDPGALCAGLAAALSPDRLLVPGAVIDVEEGPDGVEVALEDGTRLRADHVVIATLGPVHDPALLSTRCEPRRSYAVAAEHPSPPLGTYISSDEASRSIRAARPGDGIVVGGAGHVVAEHGGRSSAERWADLERYAREQLGAGEVTHRWVAHDLEPSDCVPFIGRVAPGAERRWVATGFQKWGIATSWVAADLLLGEMEGAPRSWAPLFDPRRIAPSLTSRLAQDAARSLRHLVVDRVRDLRPGQPRRPRCSHLGCVLDFDEDERTWDCACHGSRFDAEGAPIAGPASRPVSVRRQD